MIRLVITSIFLIMLNIYLPAQNGCTGTASITVTIEDCTATSELTGLSLFEVSPNPAIETILLTFDAAFSMEGNISLIDANGRVLLKETLLLNGLTTKKVDISSFPTGVYCVVLDVQNKRATRKFIVE